VHRLKKAGVEAKVDVYPTGFHAFDMLQPYRKISKQAVKEFEKQFLYAREHYFAKQVEENL
jgi:acetyl esterase/lipase